jgi:hypothetical protein
MLTLGWGLGKSSPVFFPFFSGLKILKSSRKGFSNHHYPMENGFGFGKCATWRCAKTHPDPQIQIGSFASKTLREFAA